MATATDQLEQLKQRYQSMFNTIEQQQIRLTHVNMDGQKLFVQGDAPSEDAKNRVWDVIKIVNPNWQDDLIADIRVTAQSSGAAQPTGGASVSAPASAERTYIVKSGDNLSKIAKQFYGNPNEYKRILQANRDQIRDENEIRPGQELKIPS